MLEITLKFQKAPTLSQLNALQALCNAGDVGGPSELAAMPAPVKTPKTAKPAPAATEDDFMGEETESDEKEITQAEVFAALKAYAKVNGNEKAIKILKKLGVKSARDIQPEQYGTVISACAV